MNIYDDFDPIIDRSTWTIDRLSPIVLSGRNVLTSSADIVTERDFQDLVRSTLLKKYPELLSPDISFDNMLRWFNIHFQTNKLALEPRLYARVQKSALRPLGDELDLTIPNFILEYYMDQNPSVTENDIRYNPTVAIYKYGQAHRGFVPHNNTSSVYRGRPVPVLREHILKYLTDTNTRINDLRNLGVSGLDIIQHCFPRPSSTQGPSEETKEESQNVDTSTRRTLSRRARSSRATSRMLSAPVDVPFATLRHLPTRPIASTGQWALPPTRLMGEQYDIRIPDHIIAFDLSSYPFHVISSLNAPRGLRNAIRRYHNEHAIYPPSATTSRYDGEPVYIPEEIIQAYVLDVLGDRDPGQLLITSDIAYKILRWMFSFVDDEPTYPPTPLR